MLVMLRQSGAGFQGITGLLGKQGFAMLPGQRPKYHLTLGNSLQRSELTSFVPRFLMDAVFLVFGCIWVKIFFKVILLTKIFFLF